ncbi:hypothetical protein BDZ45DRAFT_773785 [Acephala macrosclerotiorum]|nr:hypothetical protein BDZ45DRAFT_773785 [Acephala macrosclerotiorum]
MPPLIAEEYVFIPKKIRLSFKESVLEAIPIFLQAYPNLDPPSVQDNQPHLEGQRHGSVILSLWEQNSTFNTNNPYWAAFMTFFDTLSVTLHASSAFESKYPEAYVLATATYNTRLASDDGVLGGWRVNGKTKAEAGEGTQEETNEKNSEGIQQEALPKGIDQIGEVIHLDLREDRSDNSDECEPESEQDNRKVLDQTEEKSEKKADTEDEKIRKITSELLTKLQELFTL